MHIISTYRDFRVEKTITSQKQFRKISICITFNREKHQNNLQNYSIVQADDYNETSNRYYILQIKDNKNM